MASVAQVPMVRVVAVAREAHAALALRLQVQTIVAIRLRRRLVHRAVRLLFRSISMVCSSASSLYQGFRRVSMLSSAQASPERSITLKLAQLQTAAEAGVVAE